MRRELEGQVITLASHSSRFPPPIPCGRPGSFSSVVRGQLEGIGPVAVKLLLPKYCSGGGGGGGTGLGSGRSGGDLMFEGGGGEDVSSSSRRGAAFRLQFAREAAFLQRRCEPPHPNIVRCYGLRHLRVADHPELRSRGYQQQQPALAMVLELCEV